MLKIINDTGAVVGTKIIDTETGRDFANCCTGLVISMAEGGDPVTVAIKVAMVRTEVTANKADWLIKNPETDEFAPVSSITFRDGSTIVFGEDGKPIQQPISVAVVGSSDTIHFRGKPA